MQHACDHLQLLPHSTLAKHMISQHKTPFAHAQRAKLTARCSFRKDKCVSEKTRVRSRKGESNGGSGEGSGCDSYGPMYGGGPVATNRLGRKGGLGGHGRTTATVVASVPVLAAVAPSARGRGRRREGNGGGGATRAFITRRRS